MSGIEIPEEPKGVGSVIRVVFKDMGHGEDETFYVGVASGLWVEYALGGVAPDLWAEHYSGGLDEFTWEELVQIIEYDEAESFEVAYEGFGDTGLASGYWVYVNGHWVRREAR